MQNIDVRFNASSNFSKVEADLAALKAQAASLSAVLASSAYAKTPALVDPTNWKVASRAMHEASNAYRNAASSSGLLTTQQIRATSEAERYTKALQKQKVTFGEIRKHSGIMKQVYQDQLRYQRMTAQYWGTDLAGRAITDITIPKNVPRDLDTVAQKTYFIGEQAKNAGTQYVNLGKNMQWAGRQLTVGFTYPVTIFGAAAGIMAYQVDEAMTRVTKVYDVSAAAQQDEALRTQELSKVRERSWAVSEKAASEYGQSVKDTLEIEQALAASGLSGQKLFKSTDEVSRIAALGDLDVQQSTDMTIALQTAFKDTIKTGEDLTKTFDFMNAVENATSLGLQDIAEATPRAASGLAGLGVNAKEMTVMLVAMREAGVDAAEGANALKSATTRILNPVKKASDYYKEYGINLEAISRESGGNLFQFLQLLAKEQQKIVGKTEKETNRLRQKGIATLFGTYQFNRLNAALVGVSDAMTGTGDATSQTAKAWQLMSEDAKVLGDRAEQELGEKMASASGKFKAAWESARIELAKVGEPFLEAATKILEAGNDALKFFNDLPGWTKNVAGLVAALMAIAGPVVMMGGLFMNLGGQFVTGIGKALTAAGKLGGAVGLITKEEQAAKLSADAQNAAMAKQQATASTLTQELNVLSAAYDKATRAATAFTTAKPAQGGLSGVVEKPRTWEPASPQQQFLGMPLGSAAGRYEEPVKKTAEAYGQAAANAQVLARTDRERLNDQVKNSRVALQEQKIREGIEKNVNGTSIAMAAMAASSAAWMLPLGETGDKIAQWGLIASMAVPAIHMGAEALGGAASRAKDVVSQQLANVKATAAATTGQGALSRAMTVTKVGAVGFGAALNAAMGPIGWITLGLTAAAGVFLAIKSHNDKIREQQEALIRKQTAANKAMLDSSAKIAENMGKTAGAYSQIVSGGGEILGAQGIETQTLKGYNYFKENEEGKKAIGALQTPEGDLLDTEALLGKVRTQYLDLQVIGKMTADQARQWIAGMLMAAGMASVQATEMAAQVYKEYGKASKIDWVTPLKDQANELGRMAREAFKLETTVTGTQGNIQFNTDFVIDDEKKKQLYTEAENMAAQFQHAISTAATPQQARNIFKTYMDEATSQWNVGFQNLMSSTVSGSEKVKALFKEYGISSGKEFADAMRNNADFEAAYDKLMVSPSVNKSLQGQLQYAEQFATEYEHAFIVPLAKSSMYLEDNVMTATTAMEQFYKAIGADIQTPKQAAANIKKNSDAYKEYIRIQRIIQDMHMHGNPAAREQEILDLTNKMNAAGRDATKEINKLNAAFGFKQGKNATEAMNYLLNRTKANADGAADSVDDIDKNLKKLPKNQTVNIRINQVGGIIQTAMSNVQSAMADSATNAFNERWDNTLSQAQDTWDSRQDSLAASHEAATDKLAAQQEAASSAMDRRQEAATAAFEARWERRREAIEKSYQKRIDRVNRAIEAEQKADTIRQRLFEKEKARLAALAERENTNIDFNTALEEGRLDDAAKIANNAGAAQANAQMDAEQAAAEARTQARINALEKKNARLEAQRDKELQNLQKLEERMRRHLERVQEARRNALEKEHAAQSKALERQQNSEAKALEKREEASMASLEKQRDYEEAMLQQRLELFKSYVARNKKDLERWMRQVGLQYDDFGSDVKAKGENWSKHFRTELVAQLRKAGMQVKSDNMWEGVGRGIANKLLKGLGFASLADFRKFVRTGTGGGSAPIDAGNPKDNSEAGSAETRHTGGLIGSGKGSRGNIPNTYKGLHRTEKMVRAQKGEYMINKKAAANNMPLLESINRGDTPEFGTDEHGVGGYGGPVGLMAAGIATMFAQGVGKAFQNAYQVGLAKQRANMMGPMGPGGTFSGAAGTYGGRSFDATQMKHAATIASVGAGMGMSARDLQIGIMTAITESGLVNVNYGDRDSLGLFQQRPSMGWGTPAQVTDPVYASRAFFTPLKAHAERNSESPWLAAQHIQRSAFSDGSNYAKWWPAAQAIFTKGLTRKKNGGGYTPAMPPGATGGKGGWSRPADPGKGWSNSHDYRNSIGSPLYAYNDGVVTTSKATTSGGSPGNGLYSTPYTSYGETIVIRGTDGNYFRYAHLNPGGRFVGVGQHVRGGQLIGRSGNTGNSTGPHTHFDVNGSYNASGFLSSHGIGLRTGGTIRYDDTPARLHRGETVLTAPLTRKFKDNVENGGGNSYHVTLDLRGAMIKENVDIEKAVNKAIDERELRTGKKRIVR